MSSMEWTRAAGQRGVGALLLLTSLALASAPTDLASSPSGPALPLELQVQVVDAEGRPLPGLFVDWKASERRPGPKDTLHGGQTDASGKIVLTNAQEGAGVVRVGVLTFRSLAPGEKSETPSFVGDLCDILVRQKVTLGATPKPLVITVPNTWRRMLHWDPAQQASMPTSVEPGTQEQRAALWVASRPEKGEMELVWFPKEGDTTASVSLTFEGGAPVIVAVKGDEQGPIAVPVGVPPAFALTLIGFPPEPEGKRRFVLGRTWPFSLGLLHEESGLLLPLERTGDMSFALREVAIAGPYRLVSVSAGYEGPVFELGAPGSAVQHELSFKDFRWLRRSLALPEGVTSWREVKGRLVFADRPWSGRIKQVEGGSALIMIPLIEAVEISDEGALETLVAAESEAELVVGNDWVSARQSLAAALKGEPLVYHPRPLIVVPVPVSSGVRPGHLNDGKRRLLGGAPQDHALLHHRDPQGGRFTKVPVRWAGGVLEIPAPGAGSFIVEIPMKGAAPAFVLAEEVPAEGKALTEPVRKPSAAVLQLEVGDDALKGGRDQVLFVEAVALDGPLAGRFSRDVILEKRGGWQGEIAGLPAGLYTLRGFRCEPMQALQMAMGGERPEVAVEFEVELKAGETAVLEL